MYQEILQELGLSPNEAKIYQTLVEKGENGISAISTHANIHRRNAYDAISRLVEKGLCFEIFSNKETRYNAVDPDKLLELVSEKQQKLQSLLPELKKKFSHRRAPEEAYIYRGLEGQKNIMRDVLRVGKDSYFIGAKGGWFDPRLEIARKAYFAESRRKKIKFIQLFDYEVKKVEDFPKYFEGKLEYRFLPKEASTPSAIHIFGDYVVTYTGMHIKRLNDDVVFFVIQSKELAESYRKWFWFMWNKAEK